MWSRVKEDTLFNISDMDLSCYPEQSGGIMLESIDMTEPKMSKEEYRSEYDSLISRLIVLQQKARSEEVGLVVLFEGWKGAGKGSRISDLVYHLDARGTSVHVAKGYGTQETMHIPEGPFGATGFFPPMQQFWKALGTRGNMTFFDCGWYTLATQYMIDRAIAAKKRGRTPEKYDLLRRVLRVVPSIESFESQLVSDGYVIVKFFFHISEETQRERLEGLHADPTMRWRVSEEDLRQLKYYKNTYEMYDELLKKTNFGSSEWVLLNASDKRKVNLTVVRTLVEVLEKRLGLKKNAATIAAEQKAETRSDTLVKTPDFKDERFRSDEENKAMIERAEKEAQFSLMQAPVRSRFPILHNRPSLETADHTLKLEHSEYKKLLKEEQNKLFALEPQLYINRIPMIIMYEGWDAAGKGGNIKRVAQALDARAYSIFPSPAPTKYELEHPHLWRYWTRLPKAGHVGIYDRSWYGRVLVERVEGFASPSQWAAAYDEINEFELDLVNWGAILIKFWVNISPEVQLERFIARENNPDKTWKITHDDWRNRDKTPQYRAAIEDMFRLTSTEHAPWTLLESDDKYYARVKALRIINAALEKRLKEF